MATVNLGRIKPIWQGQWAASTAYVKDDIVRYGVDSYICVTAHTSSADFATDSANWNTLAQGADIPSQAGQSGNLLTTDGTNLSWGSSKTGSVAFGAHVSTDVNVSSSVWTKMEAQVEGFDRGNCYDAPNARFIAPEDGVYYFTGNINVSGITSNGDKVWVRFYVNGNPAPQYAETRWSGWAAANDEANSHNSAVLQLNANDYVEFYFYQNAGGRQYRASISRWSGFRIA